MLNISVRHVPRTFPCVCAQAVILFQLHVIFNPAILSQLHETCCTEFNLFPFLFHVCLPIHVKIKDKLKKDYCGKKLSFANNSLQSSSKNHFHVVVFIESELPVNCSFKVIVSYLITLSL